MGTAELQRRNYVQRKEARAGATLSRRRGTGSRCGTRPIVRSVGEGAARARGFARVATRGVCGACGGAQLEAQRTELFNEALAMYEAKDYQQARRRLFDPVPDATRVVFDSPSPRLLAARPRVYTRRCVAVARALQSCRAPPLCSPAPSLHIPVSESKSVTRWGLRIPPAHPRLQALIAFENIVGLEPKKYMGDNFQKVTNIFRAAQYNIACCYSQIGSVDAGLEALQARPPRSSTAHAHPCVCKCVRASERREVSAAHRGCADGDERGLRRLQEDSVGPEPGAAAARRALREDHGQVRRADHQRAGARAHTHTNTIMPLAAPLRLRGVRVAADDWVAQPAGACAGAESVREAVRGEEVGVGREGGREAA